MTRDAVQRTVRRATCLAPKECRLHIGVVLRMPVTAAVREGIVVDGKGVTAGEQLVRSSGL